MEDDGKGWVYLFGSCLGKNGGNSTELEEATYERAANLLTFQDFPNASSSWLSPWGSKDGR